MNEPQKRIDRLEKGILDAQQYYDAENAKGPIAFPLRIEQVPMQLATIAAHQLKEATTLREKLNATQAQLAHLEMMVKAVHKASEGAVGTIDNPVEGSQPTLKRLSLYTHCMTCQREFGHSETAALVTGGAVCAPNCANAKRRHG